MVLWVFPHFIQMVAVCGMTKTHGITMVPPRWNGGRVIAMLVVVVTVSCTERARDYSIVGVCTIIIEACNGE